MLKIENVEVVGWEAAIRGMRNPMNSWGKSDSGYCTAMCMHGEPYRREDCHNDACANGFVIGDNDRKLMEKLALGGPVHAKYRRMITVYVDITAPLYWWKEFDTYKVGTVANSCSTMHKIHEKELTLDDFSHEHLYAGSREALENVIHYINNYRKLSLMADGSKEDWWQMIQLLPSSYNQKRTVMLNYEVLAGIYPMRKGHKLDEWHTFCGWIKTLPNSEIIIGGNV